MMTKKEALSHVRFYHPHGSSMFDPATPEQEAKARLLCSGLRGRFLRASFENFVATSTEQRHARATCQNFAETLDPNRWGAPWLIGAPGSGKTHLGAACVRHVIEHLGLSAQLASARDIVQHLRSSWGANASPMRTEQMLVDDLVSFALLVIDEVGVGFGSDAELVQLYSVIDARYSEEKPTMLISNLNQPSLKAAIGDRLFDRLQERAQVLPCAWPSHRGSYKGPE